MVTIIAYIVYHFRLANIDQEIKWMVLDDLQRLAVETWKRSIAPDFIATIVFDLLIILSIIVFIEIKKYLTIKNKETENKCISSFETES